MKFKAEDVRFMSRSGSSPEGYRFIESTGWGRIDPKREVCSVYFEYNGKTYCFTDYRHGSHLINWYYESSNWGDMIECPEVYRKQEITWVWKEIV